MVQRPDDNKLVFENSRDNCWDSLVKENGVLLFAGKTVGDVEHLIEKVREERIRDILGPTIAGQA